MARAIDANRMKEELLWGNVFLSAKEINALVDLIDNQPTLTPPNEWVSVEERRPQAGHDVISLLPCGDCAVVWWTGSVWRVRWDATQLYREPTHWMPLPAPPDRRPPEGEEDA